VESKERWGVAIRHKPEREEIVLFVCLFFVCDLKI